MFKLEDIREIGLTIDEAHATSGVIPDLDAEDFHTGVGAGVRLAIKAQQGGHTVAELLRDDEEIGTDDAIHLLDNPSVIYGALAGSLAVHRLIGENNV